MTQEEWGRPAEVGGEFVKPAQLNGHLVIVYPLGYIPFIQTKFSGQSNKPSDAIAVDVVDLDDFNDFGQPGRIYRNSNFMQGHLIAALRTQIGSKVLGMISQGVAKNGMNIPWIIVDMSANPEARERGSQWIAANPDFKPSPFVMREQRPATPPPTYAQPQGNQYGSGDGMQYPASNQYQPQMPAQAFQPNGAPPAQYGQQPQQYQQRPSAPPPQYQPAQPQYQGVPQQGAPQYSGPQYTPVAGSPQISTDEMTVLQQHRAMRAAAEKAEAQRQAGFVDEPPF